MQHRFKTVYRIVLDYLRLSVERLFVRHRYGLANDLPAKRTAGSVAPLY